MQGSEQINEILLNLGIKAPTFAKRIDVKYQRILDIQTGKVKKISGEVANKIVNTYPQFDVNWLLTGEGSMLRDLPGPTNSENTNQQSDDMIHDKFFQALERRDKQIDEMLAQQSRLIGVIERLHGITDAGARISTPPLQNQGQDCLK